MPSVALLLGALSCVSGLVAPPAASRLRPIAGVTRAPTVRNHPPAHRPLTSRLHRRMRPARHLHAAMPSRLGSPPRRMHWGGRRSPGRSSRPSRAQALKHTRGRVTAMAVRPSAGPRKATALLQPPQWPPKLRLLPSPTLLLSALRRQRRRCGLCRCPLHSRLWRAGFSFLGHGQISFFCSSCG
jgi:hypothetical protein